MIKPTQDTILIEQSAETLRAKYMGYGRNHVSTTWADTLTLYKDYWRELATSVLKVAEDKGYHLGLPPSIEEALNSGDGSYRP